MNLFSKLLHPCLIFFSFLFHTFEFIFSKKIYLNGSTEQSITLYSGQRYSISCKENSKLLLKFVGLPRYVSIKLNEKAQLNLISEKPIKFAIQSVNIADDSCFCIPSNIVCEIKREKIQGKACIRYEFDSWEHLRATNLSFLNISDQDQNFIKY